MYTIDVKFLVAPYSIRLDNSVQDFLVDNLFTHLYLDLTPEVFDLA